MRILTLFKQRFVGNEGELIIIKEHFKYKIGNFNINTIAFK